LTMLGFIVDYYITPGLPIHITLTLIKLLPAHP
jgi:hypothetical protein